jgi:hypothetical protein
VWRAEDVVGYLVGDGAVLDILGVSYEYIILQVVLKYLYFMEIRLQSLQFPRSSLDPEKRHRSSRKRFR